MTMAVRLLLSQQPFEGRVIRCATSGVYVESAAGDVTGKCFLLYQAAGFELLVSPIRTCVIQNSVRFESGFLKQATYALVHAGHPSYGSALWSANFHF